MASSKSKNKALLREIEEKFCAQCANLLPPPDVKIGYVVCPACKKKWISREINAELRATFHYEYEHKKTEEEEEDEVDASTSAAGPTVSRWSSSTVPLVDRFPFLGSSKMHQMRERYDELRHSSNAIGRRRNDSLFHVSSTRALYWPNLKQVRVSGAPSAVIKISNIHNLSVLLKKFSNEFS